MASTEETRKQFRVQATWLYWIPTVVTLASLVALWWQTFQISRTRANAADAAQWPWIVLVVGLVVAVITYWLPRKGRPNSLAVILTLIAATLAVALGLATYLPCVDRVYLAPVGWILELFVGGVESPESPGAPCSATWSPGFQLARVFGLSATVIGAVAAAALLGQQQLTRSKIRRSPDVDVVVGLGPAQLELIRALVADNTRRLWREPWIDGRPGWRGNAGTQGAVQWLTGMRKADWRALRFRKTLTVVIDPDPNNPWAAEARQIGASVLTADPSDPTIVALVIMRNGWRRQSVAMRRFFAITDDPQYNETLGRTVQRILTVERDPRCRGHVHDELPLLFVRFADHRTAKAWTVRNLETGNDLACQGITDLGSTMATIVKALVKPTLKDAWRVTEITLVGMGGGGLVPTLLDEIAWQCWQRYEVSARPLRNPDEPVPTPVQPNLRSIHLIGPQADLLTGQWNEFRAPWQDPGAAEQLQLPGLSHPNTVGDLAVTETIVSRKHTKDPCAIVFLDAGVNETARRVAQWRPGDFIFCFDPSITGVQAPPAPGLPYLFGPQYVIPGEGLQPPAPPTDLIHMMAEQQHAVYRQSWPTPNTTPVVGEKKATAFDWPALPQFFRSDNVRQVAKLIDWFQDQHCQWTQVSTKTPPLDHHPDRISALARAEFTRWRRLREDRSWVRGAVRNDSWRTHPDLGEEPESLEYNEGIERAILRRLWAYGLAPVPLTVVERIGRVTATQLDAARSWYTANGDLLSGAAGDWLVVDESGGERTVAAKAFADTYRHVEGKTYERFGTMWARKAEHHEIVDTWEGPAVAEPGMWIMTGPHGNHWPVPNDTFEQGYRIVSG
jgi:hypothetical protein